MYDVIVLGGGVVGASTADALTQRGCRVLLLEQFEPAHTHGSSHGDGRIIRFDYGEPIYVEMVRQAYAAWEALAARVGEPVMRKTGTCNFGPADSPQLAELERNLREAGIAYERLSAREVCRRFPQFALEEGSEAVYQADGGVLFADRIVRALWRLAQVGGAGTATCERVDEIDVRDDRVRVHARSGHAWAARRFVLAAGSWSGAWLAHLGLDVPLRATQEQVAYFPAKDGVDHAAGVMPNGIDYHTSQPFYCVPQIEVPGVKAAWHHTGPEVDPDHPQPLNEANLAAVQDFIRRRCPHLDPKPIKTQRCLYTNTPDYHFILDRHPAFPHVVIAAGFSGHGFKFGPVLGRILSALLFDEPPPVALDMFAISRFADPDRMARRSTA